MIRSIVILMLVAIAVVSLNVRSYFGAFLVVVGIIGLLLETRTSEKAKKSVTMIKVCFVILWALGMIFTVVSAITGYVSHVDSPVQHTEPTNIETEQDKN